MTLSTPLNSERLQRASHLLHQLYREEQATNLLTRIQERLPAAVQHKELGRNECMLICYADSIRSEDQLPMAALHTFLHNNGGAEFGRVHLLPFFPSSSDDGFAVIDYRRVDHLQGSWETVHALAQDYDLMFDLVINHCSRESLWFADFINGQKPGCDYFITLPEESDVSAVARPRTTPLISAAQTYSGIRHVWNTFSEDQLDLDFSNPDVLYEFVDILFFYIDRGASIIRLDAIGFLWKRLGSSCLNLPETHVVVKFLRLLVDAYAPHVRLITETNVPHDENVAYFGDGDEAHLVYQFSLAPLLLYSFVFGDSTYLQRWASSLEPAPEGTSFLNFLGSHDGIGLRPLEGLIPESNVQALVDRMHERGGFVTLRETNAGKKPYEINISLMSALGGDSGFAAFMAAHAMLLAFQGAPAIYIHSLLGTLNDLDLVEQTGRTRSINRKSWNLEELNELLLVESNQRRTLEGMIQLLKKRNAQPALQLSAHQEVLQVPSGVFALRRTISGQSLLALCSVSEREQVLSGQHLDLKPGTYYDVLTDEQINIPKDFTLSPFEARWLIL